MLLVIYKNLSQGDDGKGAKNLRLYLDGNIEILLVQLADTQC